MIQTPVPDGPPPQSGGPVDPAFIDDLVLASHILAEQGVLDGYGHCSVRHPHAKDRFFLSASLSPAVIAVAAAAASTASAAVTAAGTPCAAAAAIAGAVAIHHQALPKRLFRGLKFFTKTCQRTGTGLTIYMGEVMMRSDGNNNNILRFTRCAR